MLKGIFGKYPARVRQVSLQTDAVVFTYFHHYHSFLYNIADTSTDQLQQNIDTSFCSFVDLDGSLANSLDTSSHEVNINFRGIPNERSETA